MSDYKIFTEKFDELVTDPMAIGESYFFKKHEDLNEMKWKKRSFEAKRAKEVLDRVGFDSISQSGKKVCFLIDRSGSSRGAPSDEMFEMLDVFANIFEEHNREFEVLSYTTREWKGGESRKYWLQMGKMQSPGRLNDLLHIVQKNYDQKWYENDDRMNMTLAEKMSKMMTEYGMKENIDGEALAWARDRVLENEDGGIIVFIGDGISIDDSTMTLNPKDFLSKHANEVVKDIESREDVSLIWIDMKEKRELKGDLESITCQNTIDRKSNTNEMDQKYVGESKDFEISLICDIVSRTLKKINQMECQMNNVPSMA